METALATAILPAGDEAVHKAARCLKQGGLVAFPTETVYGLGADATNAGAIARLSPLGHYGTSKGLATFGLMQCNKCAPDAKQSRGRVSSGANHAGTFFRSIMSPRRQDRHFGEASSFQIGCAGTPDGIERDARA